MNFHEICAALTRNEFSQLNIGFNNEGRLDDKHYDHLLGSVNLGLADLHTRFNLKMNCIELVFNQGRYRYHLQSDHKYSDESLVVGDHRLDLDNLTLLTDLQQRSDPEYIRDQPYAPFQNDILLITRVTSPCDKELDLNKLGNPWSFMTPKANVLEAPRRIVDQTNDLPHWLRMDRVFVHYRQGHVWLPDGAGQYDGNRVEIDLPETHRRALMLFVASRTFNPVGMGQEFNAANTYYQQYLLECQTLTEAGMYVQQDMDDSKFGGGGFV
jgi:hypothetical protein